MGVGTVANEEHLRILSQGVEVWNQWREENRDVRPDLAGANLRDAKLAGANLWRAKLMETDLVRTDLTRANLRGARLWRANLTDANLKEADMTKADLRWARLIEADLTGANLTITDLTGAYLIETTLTEANLTEADLSKASLVETKIEGVKLTGSRVYGISAWRLEGKPEDQSNLIITHPYEPVVTIDNLEVAQFIYLRLHNPKIRDVIDTIAKKAVLILGSFKEERKTVLDAIREELRRRDYLPIMFDFEKPVRRNTAETVSTLAHISKFIVADITDARSIPAELERIVPKLPSVPVQPLLLSSEEEYGLFDSIECFDHVLNTYRYDNQEMLLANLKEHVIDPAEAKARELIPPPVTR